MFKKWIEKQKQKLIAKKENKLNKLPVFHQSIDLLHVQIGTYRSGSMRAFDMLVDNHTKQTTSLINATMALNAQQDLVLTGTIQGEDTSITNVFPKDEIKWNHFDHFYNIGLDEELDMCLNPNGGRLDISLQNGDSLLIHYTLDEQKNKQLVVS